MKTLALSLSAIVIIVALFIGITTNIVPALFFMLIAGGVSVMIYAVVTIFSEINKLH